MSDREKLLQSYSQASFYAWDVSLFLDTHPFHSEALACHHHYANLAASLKEQYEKLYGPLTSSSSDASHCWDWIDGPWPWEL